MHKVGITGVCGALGRRVAAAFVELGAHVSGIDVEGASAPDGVEFVVGDVVSADLATVFRGVDTLVHLASIPVTDEHPSAAAVNVGGTRRLLDAAADNGARHVVLMSSATVYGAWPDNPVPLTEDAPLRPTPEFAYAAQKAEIERIAAQWSIDHAATLVTVLRPAVTVGPPDEPAWLAQALAPGLAERVGGTLPPVQYVHVDDLASAIVHTVGHGISGTFNVAASDWITGEDLGPLLGPGPRFPLSDRVSKWVASARRWFGHDPLRGTGNFGKHACVVATDRLRATGWAPRSTSAEALVASRRPSPLGSFVTRHRQEVTLAVVIAAIMMVVGALAGGLMVRRRRNG